MIIRESKHNVASADELRGGVSFRSYGKLRVIMGGTTPMPAGIAEIDYNCTMQSGHAELWQKFDQRYFRCQVRIAWAVYPDDAAVRREVVKTFPDRASLLAFINANTTTGEGLAAEYVSIEVFDLVDTSIAPPPKVFGKNRFFAALISGAVYNNIQSKGHYHGYQTGSCYFSNSKQPQFRADVLNALWNALYPGSPMPATNTWTSEEFGCFWLPRNRARRYQLPAFNANSLSIPDGDGSAAYRRVRLAGVTVPRPFGAGGRTDYNGAVPQPAYVAIDPAASSYEVVAFIDTYKALQAYLREGWSVLIGYPLIRTTEDGDELSVFVKPVGVDSFFFDSFDSARYQLEVVGVYDRQNYTKMKPLTVLFSDFANRTAGPVSSLQIADVMGFGSSRTNSYAAGRHGYNGGKAKFQLRDLQTNRVSPLSAGTVESCWRRRGRPFSLEVSAR